MLFVGQPLRSLAARVADSHISYADLGARLGVADTVVKNNCTICASVIGGFCAMR
jgi:hypothetical protein